MAGSLINLIPVFGVAAGYALLGERLTPSQLTGAAIVLTAVTLLALTPARDSDDTTTPPDTPTQQSLPRTQM